MIILFIRHLTIIILKAVGCQTLIPPYAIKSFKHLHYFIIILDFFLVNLHLQNLNLFHSLILQLFNELVLNFVDFLFRLFLVLKDFLYLLHHLLTVHCFLLRFYGFGCYPLLFGVFCNSCVLLLILEKSGLFLFGSGFSSCSMLTLSFKICLLFW